MKFVAVLLSALLFVSSGAAEPIPPAPQGDDFVHDLANLLDRETEDFVQDLAEDAYRSLNSPIVVVTISRMRDYGSSSIEGLATRWFNEWRIGTLGLERGTNQGILLLVSVQDRKARIELGAVWGRRWDRRCQRIMAGDIVPSFKEGDYPGGIRAGVQALHDMAKLGPDSHPPGDFLRDAAKGVCHFSWFPAPIALLCFGLGVVLILVGYFGSSDNSGFLLTLGVGLVLFGCFTYIMVLGIAMIVSPSRRSSGGSFSGGGGFSGGFSGGGGASGSW